MSLPDDFPRHIPSDELTLSDIPRLDGDAIQHGDAHAYHDFAYTLHDHLYGDTERVDAVSRDNTRIRDLDDLRSRLFDVARSSRMAYDFEPYNREMMVLTELIRLRVLLSEHGIDPDA